MNVAIISDRLPITSQLRFALSASSYTCTVAEQPLQSCTDQQLRQIATNSVIVFLAMTQDVLQSVRLLTELRPCSAARIVAVGVAESPQQLLQVLQAGADAFVDESGDLHRQVKTEMDRVAQRMQDSAPAPDGSLIAVTGAVGGAGATIVTANLSVALAELGQPCGLIDLSGGYGELATLFGVQPRHTLSELCSNSETLDLEMLKNSITEHSSGVQMIASGAVVSEWEFDSTQATRRVVETSCRMLPNIVLDLNRRAPYSDDLLAMCDVIVLMTRLDFPAACSTQRLLETWSGRGIDAERVVLVTNRFRSKGELAVSMLESMLERRIDCRLSDDALTANLSVNCGNPAVLESPHSAFSKDLKRLQRIVHEKLPSNEAATDHPSADGLGDSKSMTRLLRRVAAGFF